MYKDLAAAGCLGWYAFIALVSSLGTVQIFRHFSRLPSKPISSHLENKNEIPHVTIIRPCMGLEPYLRACLVATFYQDYPADKLTLSFCVASKSDAAYPILLELLEAYKNTHDVRVYIEEDDAFLHGRDIGPNPKIRNISHAYREAQGDIVWILDCNIWVGRGACGRMVDKLCGFVTAGQKPERPYKLVAHLPVCVNVDRLLKHNRSQQGTFGGLLEQSFLSTAHAKFYVAINSVAVAPCINGKSTAFRKSHLNYLTQAQGTDFFGPNICEDHLIGDLLWKSYLPPRLEKEEGEWGKSNPNQLEYRNHGIAFSDLAVQPIASMSLMAYVARRVRWQRVRKFTVPTATLVEPGTESLLCSAVGAWGATTSHLTQHWCGSSWMHTGGWFMLSMGIWVFIDWFVFGTLQGGKSVEAPDDADHDEDAKLPPFIRSSSTTHELSAHPPILSWCSAWVCREVLALPIWGWAVFGGTTVVWRGRKFWVGLDMKVHEISSESTSSLSSSSSEKHEKSIASSTDRNLNNSSETKKNNHIISSSEQQQQQQHGLRNRLEKDW